jgi:thiol:disulfide interchange protein DsbD
MRFFLAFLLLFAAMAHADEELLEPEKAFRQSARADRSGQPGGPLPDRPRLLPVQGQDQFSADGDVKLGRPALPAGKIKQDDTFGKVETYRGDLRVRVPVTYPAGGAKAFNLKAQFQGCADVGVCYPPQVNVVAIAAATEPVAVTPAVAASAPPATATTTTTAEPITRQSPEVLARLKSLASGFSGAEEPEFLPPEEAFKVAITPAANGTLDARFTSPRTITSTATRSGSPSPSPPASPSPAWICPRRTRRMIPTSARCSCTTGTSM